MKLLLEEMTRDEAREAFDAGALVVLPTASTEQHGPHLPLMVDTLATTHVARAAAERARDRAGKPVIITPTMHFGVAHHHLGFAGTLSLTSRVYMDVLCDLVRSLHMHGARRVVLVNGHGGNVNANGVVAARLVHDEGLPMAIGSVSYWSLPVEGGDGSDAMRGQRAAFSPGHAGNFETSLTLALRPDLVQLDRRRAPLAPLARIDQAQEHGAFTRAGGTTDGAEHASAEAGRRRLDAIIAALTDYLAEFAQLPDLT